MAALLALLMTGVLIGLVACGGSGEKKSADYLPDLLAPREEMYVPGMTEFRIHGSDTDWFIPAELSGSISEGGSAILADAISFRIARGPRRSRR